MARRITIPKKAFKVDGVTLTPALAITLLDHAHGPRPTRAAIAELRLLQALRARSLVRFNRPRRPTHTITTARGREVLAALLATQADALAAKYDDDVPEQDVTAPLARLASHARPDLDVPCPLDRARCRFSASGQGCNLVSGGTGEQAMGKHLKTDLQFPASGTLQVGQRVSRKDSEEQGTVVEADGQIKVNWDSGQTSYFRRGRQGNVRRKVPRNSN